MIRNPYPQEWTEKFYEVGWIEWREEGGRDLFITHLIRCETHTEAISEARLLEKFFPWLVVDLYVDEKVLSGGGLTHWEGKARE